MKSARRAGSPDTRSAGLAVRRTASLQTTERSRAWRYRVWMRSRGRLAPRSRKAPGDTVVRHADSLGWHWLESPLGPKSHTSLSALGPYYFVFFPQDPPVLRRQVAHLHRACSRGDTRNGYPPHRIPHPHRIALEHCPAHPDSLWMKHKVHGKRLVALSNRGTPGKSRPSLEQDSSDCGVGSAIPAREEGPERATE